MNIPPKYPGPTLPLGEWIINVLITKIPLIGFIMLLVWALDKDTDPNKANWAKAELIVKLIGFLIIITFIAIIGISFFTNFTDQVNWSDFD